jgi:hypothetical protein
MTGTDGGLIASLHNPALALHKELFVSATLTRISSPSAPQNFRSNSAFTNLTPIIIMSDKGYSYKSSGTNSDVSIQLCTTMFFLATGAGHC